MSCKKCGADMKAGVALAHTTVGSPDFPGCDHVVTHSPGGPGKLIACWKCIDCGWSMTIPEYIKETMNGNGARKVQ